MTTWLQVTILTRQSLISNLMFFGQLFVYCYLKYSGYSAAYMRGVTKYSVLKPFLEKLSEKNHN